MGMIFYSPADHRRAFRAWLQTGSFRATATQVGVQNHRTIATWAGDQSKCSCPWHRWLDKKQELITLLTEPLPLPGVVNSPSDSSGSETSAPILQNPPLIPQNPPLNSPQPSPIVSAVAPASSVPPPSSAATLRYAALDQEWNLLLRARFQAAMYLQGQVITDQQGRVWEIPAVVPRTFGELVRALKDIHEEMRTFLGISPPPQQIRMSGEEGGPVQFEDVSRPIDERRAKIRGMLLAIKGRTERADTEDGTDNGQRQSA